MSQEKVEKLPVSLKAGWGVGALGVSVLMNGVAGVILFYLVSIVKMDPAVAGTLIFSFKILDVITDPLMGRISDRTVSGMGRRRPYLLLGCFVSTISMLVLFNVPDWSNGNAVLAYVSFGLLIYTLGYTIFNVPYITMPAEMTDGYHERSSIHGYRVVFISLGSTVGGALGPILLQMYGQTRETYSLIASLKAVMIFVSMLACFYLTKKARSIVRTEVTPKFLQQVAHMRKNQHFLKILAAKLIQLIGIFATQAALFFFFLNALQVPETYIVVYGISMTVSSIIFAPLLVRLSKRIGKPNAYIVCGVIYSLNCLSWYFSGPGESVWLIGLRGFITGIPFAGNIMLAMSMLTDTIEYDARKNGVRQEGIFTAMYSFVEKFAGAFGPLIVGLLLSFAGFDKSLAPNAGQSPEVVSALLLGMAAIPALTSFISVLIIRTYTLDEGAIEAVAPADAGPAKPLASPAE